MVNRQASAVARLVGAVLVDATLPKKTEIIASNPYIDQFLQWFTTERGRSRKSADAYLWELNRFFSFLKEQNDRADIQKISRFQIRSYLATLGDISPSTRERTVSCLKSFFRFLSLEGYITTNPAETISTPVIRKKVPNFFSRTQFIGLLGDLNNKIIQIKNNRELIVKRIFERSKEYVPATNSIVLLMLLYNISKQEMIKLRSTDFNPSSGRIQLENSKFIKLEKNAKFAMKRYLETRIQDSDYIITTKTGIRYKFISQLPSKSDLLMDIGFSKDDKNWSELVKSIDSSHLLLAHRNLAIITLLLGTGIRRSELSGLSKRNFNKKDSTITVTRKGGDQQIIELNKDVEKTLNEYLAGRIDKNKELFLTNNQKKMTSENLHYVVKNILTESGLEGSAHTLRHTFVTELVRIGVSLPVIQSLVGHRNANTTIRYTHIISKDRRSAVSKINLDFSKTK